MLDLNKRKSVDLLIEQFWKLGYLTLSRKYGTYLPEPSKIGGFDVDIIARQRKNYAIGITLTVDDLKNPNLPKKLAYLATRQTKYTNKRVSLFVGVPFEYLKRAKDLVEMLQDDIKKNIKLFQIIERNLPKRSDKRINQQILFS